MTTRPRSVGMGLAVLVAATLLGVIAFTQARSDGLLIEVYGVDTLFVLDAIMRITQRAVPHDDFTLHLGALPFALISAVSTDVASAVLKAQWALAAALIGIGWWVGTTRLGPVATAAMLISVVLVVTALSPPFDPRITLALFYNRWAWAIAIVIIVAIAVPPRQDTNGVIDGIIIGVLTMALLTTKITFFAALVPIGAFAYAASKRWAEIAIIAATCVIIALIVALTVSWTFWISYIENLMWVATNPLRQTPGRSMLGALTDTRFVAVYIAYSVFLFCVFRARALLQAGFFTVLGFALLYIQTQNFGQVPLWTLAMGVVASSWTTSDAARAARNRFGFAATAFAFFAASLPSLFPLANSSFRNASNGIAGETVIMPGVMPLAGIAVTAIQSGPIKEHTIPLAPDAPPHMSTCHVTEGFLRVFKGVADSLAVYEGPVFVADAQSPYWIQNGQAVPRNTAVWNYGSLRGLEDARFVAVPACPFKPSYQRAILTRLADEGYVLTPIENSRWVTVFTWTREAGG